MIEDKDMSISTIGGEVSVESILGKQSSDHHHHHRSYTSVMQGLTLNLNEPWERSLSRLLEDVSNTNEPNNRFLDSNNDMNRSVSSNVSLPNVASPTSTVEHTTATAVPELVLLSRTESRDYAVEIEGDSTSGTSIMNLSMDDTTTSSGTISNGTKNSIPLRSRHHHIRSIYRKSSSKKLLTTAGHKSLFDDSDVDDASEGTATSGRCRLTHKFSSDSLFLFYEQQQHLEDRGEQEDDSDRKVADDSLPNERSFSIHKASAICEEHDNDDNLHYNFYSNNSYYESRQLFIPDHRPSRSTVNRHLAPSELYLPLI